METKNVTNVTQKKKEEFIEAFAKSHGIISVACKKVNISRITVYRWKGEDIEFSKKFDEILEEQKDFVESRFLINIDRGNVNAQIFYLKTKCRDRGYIERTEVTANVTNAKIDVTKLTDEQLKALSEIETNED